MASGRSSSSSGSGDEGDDGDEEAVTAQGAASFLTSFLPPQAVRGRPLDPRQVLVPNPCSVGGHAPPHQRLPAQTALRSVTPSLTVSFLPYVTSLPTDSVGPFFCVSCVRAPRNETISGSIRLCVATFRATVVCRGREGVRGK